MTDRNEEERLFAELRSLRTEDGNDPFDLYQRGEVSKGWLIGKIVEVVLQPNTAVSRR